MTLIVKRWGMSLSINRRNSYTIRTSRQRMYNLRVDFLLCSVVRIYEGDGFLGLAQGAQVWSLVVFRMAIELKYRNYSKNQNILKYFCLGLMSVNYMTFN